MCVFDLSISTKSNSIWRIRPSLLFLDGHLETNLDYWFLDDRRGGDIFETLIFKYAYFDTMDRRHREEARAKLTGKIIHLWGLVALPSPPKH